MVLPGTVCALQIGAVALACLVISRELSTFWSGGATGSLSFAIALTVVTLTHFSVKQNLDYPGCVVKKINHSMRQRAIPSLTTSEKDFSVTSCCTFSSKNLLYGVHFPLRARFLSMISSFMLVSRLKSTTRTSGYNLDERVMEDKMFLLFALCFDSNIVFVRSYSASL